MEYLVFVIYAFIIIQLFFRAKASESITSSRTLRTQGQIDFILGMLGFTFGNLYIKDIWMFPMWSFYFGLVAFALLWFMGLVFLVIDIVRKNM